MVETRKASWGTSGGLGWTQTLTSSGKVGLGTDSVDVVFFPPPILLYLFSLLKTWRERSFPCKQRDYCHGGLKTLIGLIESQGRTKAVRITISQFDKVFYFRFLLCAATLVQEG